jgi:hypothetical protein
MVEVDRVDVGQIDEGLDVDRPGLAGLDGCDLLVRDDHVLAVEVIAVGDLLPDHLYVLLRAEAALFDADVVLIVQLVEAVVEVPRRAHHLDGHVHEAEAERAAPQRARHG